MNLIVGFIKRSLKSLYLLLLKVEVYLRTLYWKLRGGGLPEYHSVPIIINNFNRLDYLSRLINSLEQRGYKNIIILDNDSTYPPLLNYYKQTPYEVVYLRHNYGFLALWESGVYKRFCHQFYVYTDPDVVLDEQCPEDFMQFFLSVLVRHPACLKVGFGIRIDDLPDCYTAKQSVIKWENQFWEKPVDEKLFLAQVDTTFALYRPYCKGGYSRHQVFRTNYPYVIKHLPWYQDTENLTEEEKYYTSHSKKASHWTGRVR